MTERTDVIVVGGGQAGLALSWHLRQRGIDHLVLERARIGETSRTKRWDTFCLVTPNWTVQLPGFSYAGPDPDGFLERDEIVDYLERYATSASLPVRCGVEVTSISRGEDDAGYVVQTRDAILRAPNVVVATGHPGARPAIGRRLHGHLGQRLPPGLWVGRCPRVWGRRPPDPPPRGDRVCGTVFSRTTLAVQAEVRAPDRDRRRCGVPGVGDCRLTEIAAAEGA